MFTSDYIKNIFLSAVFFFTIHVSMSQSKFSLQSIRANNYTFKYIEAGKGPLVIALHGFPDNPFTFEKQIIALAEAGYII